MSNQLVVHNSLSRQKEVFKSIHEGNIGMYVCGPTVYSDVHLGNCRTFVSFDVIYLLSQCCLFGFGYYFWDLYKTLDFHSFNQET